MDYVHRVVDLENLLGTYFEVPEITIQDNPNFFNDRNDDDTKKTKKTSYDKITGDGIE